jgi:hypothetical protein
MALRVLVTAGLEALQARSDVACRLGRRAFQA